jgi:hypothetical protein
VGKRTLMIAAAPCWIGAAAGLAMFAVAIVASFQLTFANVTTNDDSAVSGQVPNEARIVPSATAGDETLVAPFQFADATNVQIFGTSLLRDTNS